MLALLDPAGMLVANVPADQLTAYLREHGLESEEDLGFDPRCPEDFRIVFAARYHLVLSHVHDLPRVKFEPPTLPNHEYRSPTQVCNEQQVQEQIITNLNTLLQTYPFVVYASSLWEMETFELADWCRWVDAVLLPQVVDSDLILPAGSYPEFQCAVFGRRNAGTLADYLSRLTNDNARSDTQPPPGWY